MESVFAPLGNLKGIGEKGVRIEFKKLIKLFRTEYVARKDAHKILTAKMKNLTGYYKKLAKKLIKIIEESD